MCLDKELRIPITRTNRQPSYFVTTFIGLFVIIVTFSPKKFAPRFLFFSFLRRRALERVFYDPKFRRSKFSFSRTHTGLRGALFNLFRPFAPPLISSNYLLRGCSLSYCRSSAGNDGVFLPAEFARDKFCNALICFDRRAVLHTTVTFLRCIYCRARNYAASPNWRAVVEHRDDIRSRLRAAALLRSFSR